MEKAVNVPNRIAVTWHPSLAEAQTLSFDIVQELKNRSVERAESFSLNDRKFRDALKGGEFDLVIALGGDGTMLRAGKLGAPVQVPVMGINLGHFGFLVETQRNEWRPRLDDLLCGRWETDSRMMIHAEQYRGEKRLHSWEVLNDVVLARALSIRPVHLLVHVNEIELAEYVADGLILATSTGSTSYSQSVGGPILRPDMRNMLLTPISPNLCVDRSLVLPDTDTVTFTLSGNVEALISPDGYEGDVLNFGDRVLARASEHSALFVRFEDKGIFYRNITRYMQRNPTIEGVRRS
ncbi:MAG: NAD(+)/NADH kinase [Anaerolineaceae bacterium]|nr:NAD(+)/NADH kinase [Anaerolineaceae bacterium]